MDICYIDESGCTGKLPSAISDVQPIFALGGIFIASDDLPKLARQYIDLKRDFFPPTPAKNLERMLVEVKGNDLRRDYCSGNRKTQRRATRFLHKTLDLLDEYRCKIVARVFVKDIAGEFGGQAVYTSAAQGICTCFQDHLTQRNSRGVVIADARQKTNHNITLAHSIFTKKHSLAGDPYNRIIEVPTLGNSQNHVGLQIADVVISGLLFPLAVHAYCRERIVSVHVRDEYENMRQQFGRRVAGLRYRYRNPQQNDRWQCGITVSSKYPCSLTELFRGTPASSAQDDTV